MIDKPLEWSAEKNAKLKKEWGITFETLAAAIEGEGLLASIRHPSARYTHQGMYIVDIEEYAYAVPFVEDEKKIFLKTAFPSRKFTKKYLSS